MTSGCQGLILLREKRKCSTISSVGNLSPYTRFAHLSVGFFCDAQQKEEGETQEEPLQHANNNNDT